MTYDVRLGATVFGNDGKQIGKVDGLVIDPDNMSMLEIIVHEGFLFSTDRIIETIYIDRVDDCGNVYLSVDADRADRFPPLIQSQYVVASNADRGSTPFAIGGGPTMTAPIMWRSSAGGSTMHVTSQDAYMEAVAGAAPVEVRSDLPVESVVLTTGTNVISNDGHKLGTVDEVLYDETGELTGFVVRAGRFHHHDLTVPITSVAVITHDRVRLNLDAETVRRT